MKIFNAMDLPEVDMDAFLHRVRTQGEEGAVNEISLSDASGLFEPGPTTPAVSQGSDPNSESGLTSPFGLGDD